MKLTIKTLKGEKFQLEVDDSRTVEELKGLIVGFLPALHLGLYPRCHFSHSLSHSFPSIGSREGRASCSGHEGHSQR